ncbi:radical SAM family heme chaperone HemW [Spongiibacter sp. KMU-158]|uniref:Heme chaperone HemW n=1 Tax=Spongiibacter pelagi TaxID=2760804 RepID=A0A927BZY1_9GAMM|nr:radical SAM family heme chaperone HemW [Spongiibacter pelagi]MBD2857497.1 radical SAM family heme chaperone HemW [Spongiibacter pelagi]
MLPPLSLYIHVPWCVRKCPYCDFNSHAKQDVLPEQQYIAALLEDLEQDLSFVQGRAIQSIFFGGGTPSLLSAEAYQQLFTGLKQKLVFADDIEITLEANPGTLEQGRFADYRALGINRLSIGVQSFDPTQLQKLGRIHSSNDAIKAIHSARSAGYDNFNIDLMHGLNEQSIEQALEDLRRALGEGAPHISWYQLTIEPNTEFYKQPPRLPLENDISRIQAAGFDLLAQHGFERYEVSAFAKPNHQARHNLNYWKFGDYLALGAGAHGKISFAAKNGTPGFEKIIRYQKTRKPEDYLNRIGSRTSKREDIAQEDLPLEFMMNALRLKNGVSVEVFAKHTGQPLTNIQATLNALKQQKLLADTTDKIQATEKGFLLLDSILGEFLP